MGKMGHFISQSIKQNKSTAVFTSVLTVVLVLCILTTCWLYLFPAAKTAAQKSETSSSFSPEDPTAPFALNSGLKTITDQGGAAAVSAYPILADNGTASSSAGYRMINDTITTSSAANSGGTGTEVNVPVSTIKTTQTQLAALFSQGDEIYNYCPSVLDNGDGTYQIYYCANRDSGKIVDYIMTRRGTKSGNGIQWGGESVALAPSDSGWDKQHVCDPDVVKGVFHYNNQTYSYLMAYLGCMTTNNKTNEVGIALANSPEGPWVKYAANPLVSFDPNAYGDAWGVGQPSLVSLDTKGNVMLYYTRGDKFGTRTVCRICNFSDLSNIQIGNENTVPTTGLTERDGSAPVLNNADFILDPSNHRVFVIRDRHPNDSQSPNIISSELQVAYAQVDGNGFPAGKWTVLANVASANTGYPRNHNACLASDDYGRVPSSGNIDAYFTSALTGQPMDSLWTYVIHSVTVGKK